MKTLTIILLVMLSSGVFASKEGILKFSKFTIESEGIGSSGNIKVIGQQSAENDGIKELKVLAFGKEYVIPQEQLKGITHVNGLRLSYEAGYKSLGGKTVYIVLEFGFIKRIKKSILVTVKENGESKITDLPKTIPELSVYRKIKVPEKYQYGKSHYMGMSDYKRYLYAYEQAYWRCIDDRAKNIDYRYKSEDLIGNGWPPAIEGCRDGYLAADKHINSLIKQYGKSKIQMHLRKITGFKFRKIQK